MDASEKIRALYEKNEEEGFRFLFETYNALLLSFSFRILGDKQLAEDAVQDCFVDFWLNRRIGSVSGDIGKYLFSAVMYTSLNLLRKNKRLRKLHNDPETAMTQDQRPDAEHDNISGIKQLYENIGQLPESRRKIFLMIALEGMKYQAVADQLGISVNTVKTQMKRAVKTLRGLLADPSVHVPVSDG